MTDQLSANETLRYYFNGHANRDLFADVSVNDQGDEVTVYMGSGSPGAFGVVHGLAVEITQDIEDAIKDDLVARGIDKSNITITSNTASPYAYEDLPEVVI